MIVLNGLMWFVLILILINDMNLQCTSTRICKCLHGLNGLLKGELVRYKRIEIQISCR